MKKIFTLAIAALAALSVSAQDVATKQTLAFTGNAWNVNVLATGNVGITCNSQWGEYKLTSESFDAADYSAQGGLSVADGCRCLTKELDMIAC